MKCQVCIMGEVPYHHIEYVTHEMAIDAGDRQLEGQEYDLGYEWVPCACCGGDWEDCEECAKDTH